MVSTKTHERKAIAIFVILLGIFVATLTVVGAMFVHSLLNGEVETADAESPTEEVVEPVVEPEPVVVLPEKVDFQGLVDEWVSSVGGEKSVLIYDLERDEVVGSHNSSEDYSIASLYKLFVVYEGYRRVQSGEWSGDDLAGVTGYTISECLDLAIRRSYSPCAETLWGMIGRDELDEIIVRDFGIMGSDISHLISNPEDIMKIMKIFYEHTDITDDGLVALMKDSFLNQPVTEYNWRQGLPSGFSRANVYNKVGWDFNPDGGYWNLYHDAAIVEFPEANRHYIVVVMSNRLPFQRIRELGGDIENTFYTVWEAAEAAKAADINVIDADKMNLAQ